MAAPVASPFGSNVDDETMEEEGEGEQEDTKNPQDDDMNANEM